MMKAPRRDMLPCLGGCDRGETNKRAPIAVGAGIHRVMKLVSKGKLLRERHRFMRAGLERTRRGDVTAPSATTPGFHADLRKTRAPSTRRTFRVGNIQDEWICKMIMNASSTPVGHEDISSACVYTGLPFKKKRRND